MRSISPIVALMFLVSCAGGTATVSTGSSDGNPMSASASVASASATTEDFTVSVRQPDFPPVMGGRREMDVRYVVTIENRTKEPVTVKRISMKGLGGSYEVGAGTMPFNQLIPPGEKKNLDMWLRATNLDAATGVHGSVMLRAEITFDVNGEKLEEVFMGSTGDSGVSGIFTVGRP